MEDVPEYTVKESVLKCEMNDGRVKNILEA
jgi:hypothetical protein